MLRSNTNNILLLRNSQQIFVKSVWQAGDLATDPESQVSKKYLVNIYFLIHLFIASSMTLKLDVQPALKPEQQPGHLKPLAGFRHSIKDLTF